VVIRVLLVSSTQRSSAEAGGPVAVCKAQTIVPAIGDPEILNISAPVATRLTKVVRRRGNLPLPRSQSR
jgi:hypothetical protein